jgi:N-acyl-phosphatidylethanolamine-hydrolysing phospholipase D
MNKRFLALVLIIMSFSGISCNLVLVAVRNVPTFFNTPEKVKNKIKNPINADTRLSALWIGHATVLIQMDDKVIITDPFLTETIGEFGRRITEPGIDIKDIPTCDLVLISHSHFDHLSFASLTMLEEKSSKTALVFPEDLENYLPDYNMKLYRMKNNNGYEYGYKGETKIINGIKITTVTARHWGGRYGFDGYLWGDNAFTGYILEYNGMTVYFAGDTGYETESFKKIGKEYNIDLALIPIGPCADCNQCGTPNHVFPVDAVYLFKDVNPKWMVPIHYGTLQFARADPMQPLWALNEIIAKDTLSERIYPLKIGEQKTFIAKH